MPRLAVKPRRRVVAAVRKPARKAPVKRGVYVKPVPVVTRAPKERSQAGAAFRGAGSSAGTLLGSFLGGPAGGALGGTLGRGAGAMLSKLFGHGDYQVSNVGSIKENSVALSNAANIPQFGTGSVAVKFKHREYLGDVISSSTIGAFKIDSYALNPGLAASFPWLAGVVGANFQQHRINGLTYEFRSMSADALNSTNTALGSVIMATDYDSPDAVFTTKQQMENTEFGVSCKPSSNMMHAVECARGQTPVSELYIRAYANPANTDIRLYDLGRFSIATVGCQAASVNLGELWVTYDIDAFKAIEQPPGYIVPIASYQNDTKVSMNTTTWGVAANRYANLDQIGMTFDNLTKMFFPASVQLKAKYQVNFYMQGDSTATTAGAITCGQGATLTNVSISPGAGSTTISWQANMLITIDGPIVPSALPYINIAAGTVPANITFSLINVRQVGAASVAATG